MRLGRSSNQIFHHSGKCKTNSPAGQLTRRFERVDKEGAEVNNRNECNKDTEEATLKETKLGD